jgi:hypothetical protein
MSPLDNLFEMSLFFTIVHIRVVEDMVRKNIALFQKIGSKQMKIKGKFHF